jgi:hypothetical protein
LGAYGGGAAGVRAHGLHDLPAETRTMTTEYCLAREMNERERERERESRESRERESERERERERERRDRRERERVGDGGWRGGVRSSTQPTQPPRSLASAPSPARSAALSGPLADCDKMLSDADGALAR